MGGEKSTGLDATSETIGSPPRGRRKVVEMWQSASDPGITPAWAGKSLCCCLVHRFPGDHPRMGGEKCSRWDYTPAEWGSPPHGRGKVDVDLFGFLCRGITPAWAGKSRCSWPELRQCRDHPRMGGEKLPRLYSPMWPWGSPPRRRGKVQLDDPEEGDLGITPA